MLNDFFPVFICHSSSLFSSSRVNYVVALSKALHLDTKSTQTDSIQLLPRGRRKGECGRHQLMDYAKNVGRRSSEVLPKRCILMPNPTTPSHLFMSSPLRVFFICARFCHRHFFHQVSHMQCLEILWVFYV